ncbi:hypothetical protein GCM10022228_23550 [Halomonas cibimaris]|uniref:Putative metallopeptidase domain-containing protein n=1 Tax=Halomonas cibimaris TaxID=657012 RepID=A0ABP7M321_9GAMM
MAHIVSSPQKSSTAESSLSERAQQELSKWREDRTHWHECFPVITKLAECLTLTPLEGIQNFTASTDGRRLFFCPAHSATLTDKARQFLQMHLLWHCLAGHLTAPLVNSPHCWHLACDHEINALLLALDVELPLSAVLFPICYGQSAYQVYHWLANHPAPHTEIAQDIHPAALWAYQTAQHTSPALATLWQRRAHLLARETATLPSAVAGFCASR